MILRLDSWLSLESGDLLLPVECGGNDMEYFQTYMWESLSASIFCHITGLTPDTLRERKAQPNFTRSSQHRGSSLM